MSVRLVSLRLMSDPANIPYADPVVTLPTAGNGSSRLRSPFSIALAVTRFLLSSWFAFWALFYLLTTVCAILNFGWRQPMFDEFVMYPKFLGIPFPQDVLQAGNGHRPIVPNLIILAEIKWFAANHQLQLAGGLICAVLTSLIIALAAMRERTLSFVERAAGVMLGIFALLWLANARMLLHSYESLHVYLLILAISVAGYCSYEAAHRASKPWLFSACMACCVATFTFGSGVASFPAVILLGCALRMPARWLLLPAATLCACLFLYLFALPGDQEVRGVLNFHLLKSTLIAVDWLSSPWVYALLGHGDPPLDPSMTHGLFFTYFGSALVASANALLAFTGLRWQCLARALGFLGVAVFLIRFGFLLSKRKQHFTRLQALAAMWCLFALASAAVISVGRLDYFQKFPEQVYADRYLVWPTLFWAGLALLLLADIRQSRFRGLLVIAVPLVIILPLVLLPTQQAGANWGALVYRMSEQVAAAARSDVYDSAIFPNGADADSGDVVRSLALLKRDHLAMFASPGWELVGTRWQGAVERSDGFGVRSRIAGTLVDGQTQAAAARVDGTVDHGIAAIQRSGQLAILDERDTIVGLAEFSFVREGEGALRLDVPRKRGFDGYIRQYNAGGQYRLVLLRGTSKSALLLTTVSPNDSAR